MKFILLTLSLHHPSLHIYLHPSCVQRCAEWPGNCSKNDDQGQEIVQKYPLGIRFFSFSIADGDEDDRDEHHQGMFDGEKPVYRAAHRGGRKVHFLAIEIQDQAQQRLEVGTDQGKQAELTITIIKRSLTISFSEDAENGHNQ